MKIFVITEVNKMINKMLLKKNLSMKVVDFREYFFKKSSEYKF